MSVCINLPVNDILQSVERPVVFGVIRQLMDLTQISRETSIRFYGEDAKAAQYNSTLAQDKEADNLWPHNPNIMIEVDEDHDPDRMLSMAVKGPENRFVFWDKPLNISIRPAYSPTIVTIRILYKASDKNTATKWRNEVRARTAMMRDMFMHELSYSYHIPDEMLVILNELWKLRNNIAGYGDTFGDWLTQNLSNQATEVSTLNGKDTFLSMRETQAMVIGAFDFEGVPDKPTRDDEPNLWVTTLSYKFKYEKPIEAVMVYPIIVHQQMLAMKYRPMTPEYTYQSVLKKYSYSGEKFARFGADDQKMRFYGNRGLSLPPTDQFLVNSKSTFMVKAFTALVCLDPAAPREFLNLGELGDFNLASDILDFLRAGEYAYLTQGQQSVFQLQYFDEGRIQPQANLSVSPSLDVSLLVDPNLRRPYRLRLSLVVNFAALNRAALTRLAANPSVAIKVCTAINGAIRDLSNQPDIGKSRLTLAELNSVGLTYDRSYNILIGTNGAVADPNRVFTPMALVQTLFVVAQRAPS